MRVIPLRTPTRPAPEPSGALLDHGPDVEADAASELRLLLLGVRDSLPLPPLCDVLSAALALAEGTRSKSLLPLAAAPAELVLLRRRADVLVSYYAIDDPTDVRVLDRPVPLLGVLSRCAALAERVAAVDSDPISRELTLRLAKRARHAALAPVRAPSPPVQKSGGAVERPPATVPLAFGFEASIVPVADPPRQTTAHTDVHALLFGGELWLWARGRRIPLLRGPIMVAVARMVAGVRALVEASDAGRAANVRLRAGRFVVGVRRSREGERPVQLALGDGGKVTVPELTVEEAALPILRLASDLVRALVSVDRGQTRNLRVSALRDEVRALRRRLRDRATPADRVVCDDPERLRAAAGVRPSAAPPGTSAPAPRTLRFDVRWQTEVEGLDASSTFLCGDRMVVATPRRTVCLGRDDGRVLWANDTPASVSFMTGTVLVSVGSDGRVVLTEVELGEAFAEQRIAPRVGGPPCGILAGGRSAPPVAVVAEGRDRLVAIDLRTGALRWRFTARAAGAMTLRRAGRILLVACADGTLSALDVVNGELLWRFSSDEPRLSTSPTIASDVVVTASARRIHGVDLFSGQERWARELDAPPATAPIAAPDLAVIGIGRPRSASLAAFDPASGELRWMIPDPGVARGAACLSVDRLLLVNAPAGHVEAIAIEDGQTRWERRVSHPVADDVPRRLEPVLRGGALFVPSASVHVLRVSDGSSIGDALPCELVPDWMRVDERGWVYVAEESGHLAAMAPRPHLTLVS